MRQKSVYDILSAKMVNYKRLNSSHLEVRTSGYVSLECTALEALLSDWGLQAVKRTYEAGLTKTIYRGAV